VLPPTKIKMPCKSKTAGHFYYLVIARVVVSSTNPP